MSRSTPALTVTALVCAALVCTALTACSDVKITDGPSAPPVDMSGPTPTTQPAISGAAIQAVPEAQASVDELSVLSEINAIRSVERKCGAQNFPAARPLRWNAELAGAALEHSRDMAKNGYREETATEPEAPHTGSDGSSPQDRIDRSGYVWDTSGENVAAGFKADKVVAAWLASPGHCANIMNPSYVDSGVSLVKHPGAVYNSFYTQTFGHR